MKSRENIIKTNELFGLFNKKFEFDKRAKETFSDMLKHIKDLDVRVVGDSKRDVVFGGKKTETKPEESNKEKSVETDVDKEKSEDQSETEKPNEVSKEFSVSQKYVKESSKIYFFSEFIEEKLKDYNMPQKQIVRRFETEYTKTGKTYVSVMKIQSGHRFSSKFLGATKEDSYSLSINGKHFVSDVKGKEGQKLVNPKITEMYWNFLTELGKLQDRRKRNDIKTNSEYDSEVDKLKNKYTNLLNKLK